MFHFRNHTAGQPFYHDKGFTLLWNSAHCKWLLIRFVNSQRKPWYRSTERNYRFRRWFFKKANSSFSNLANIHSPFIEVYVFTSWICIPKKQLIPMQVHRLSLDDVPLQTHLPPAPVSFTVPEFSSPAPNPALPFTLSHALTPSVHVAEVQVNDAVFPEMPLCDWPVGESIRNNLVSGQSNVSDILITMQKTKSYV